MIDGTEKPKIPSKFAKRAERYNEFGSNPLAKFAYQAGADQVWKMPAIYNHWQQLLWLQWLYIDDIWERRDLKKMAEDFTATERERED